MSYDQRYEFKQNILFERKLIACRYGHHYRNINTIILSTFFDPSFYFFTLKDQILIKRFILIMICFFFNELNELMDIIKEEYLLKIKKLTLR